jgi:hypothetical protein
MQSHRAFHALPILWCLAAGTVHAQASAPAAATSAVTADVAIPVAPPAVKQKRARATLPGLAVALDVTLAPDAKVDPELEADCRFEEIVATDVAKTLSHQHLGGGKPTGDDLRVLRVAVTDVSGSSGGVYTGTKSIRVHAALVVDGKVERETDLYRYNVGGNPFRGTCHIFRQHTKRLGRDLSAWVKDASYRAENQPMGDKDDAD